jgi:large subunit ribosomal protein L13
LRSGDRQEWWIVDAADQTLGRLAARVASLLRGKQNVLYTPHADAGDFVVVVNAERVRLTGRKRSETIYYRHTGW